jgi:hypothetical protein
LSGSHGSLEQRLRHALLGGHDRISEGAHALLAMRLSKLRSGGTFGCDALA